MYVTELTLFALRAMMNSLNFLKLTVHRNMSVTAAFLISSERDQYYGLSKYQSKQR